jgi:hypothetical protein
MPTLIGASNLTGERFTFFERAMVPMSANIKEGHVLVHSTNSGQLDNLAVDLPNGPGVLAGGRAFAGISASAISTDITVDNQVTVQKLGIAKCLLKSSTACTAGTDCGYDPADGGLVVPVTPANQGTVVTIGRFSQSKPSNASPQMVGVELHANGATGDRTLGASITTSTPITNTVTETAFSTVIPIPANQISAAGQLLRIRAKGLVTSGNASETLQLKCRLDSAAGVLLGQTPAVNVTDAGGDVAELDLVVTVRSVGVGGTMTAAGIGGISPGQAVATGGNVQMTGTAGTVAINTTIAHNLVITATWSGASTSNIVQLEDLTVLIS